MIGAWLPDFCSAIERNAWDPVLASDTLPAWASWLETIPYSFEPLRPTMSRAQIETAQRAACLDAAALAIGYAYATNQQDKTILIIASAARFQDYAHACVSVNGRIVDPYRAHALRLPTDSQMRLPARALPLRRLNAA